MTWWRFRRWMVGVVLLGLVLAVAGCGSREAEVDVAAEAGVLLWGNGTEPQSLDPHLVTGVPENRIISSLLEGLINYHPSNDNLPEPGVAERWNHSADFTEWTFYLRRDARWSSGDPVVAEDFVYSYQRMLSPDLAGNHYANNLYLLENAEAYHRGEIGDFSQVGVEALDAQTLRLRLAGPVPYLLSALKHYSWFPVHPPTIEAGGGMTAGANPWFRRNYVGNGPFVLSEWRPNSIIRVEKSPTYWDADRVRLNAIHFLPIEDINTEADMFASGALHLTNDVPPPRLKVYRERFPEALQMLPYLGVYHYRVNTLRAPLDDARVRLALSLAIDRRSIVERITMGGQTPATGYTPPGVAGYPVLDVVGYDPARARELLAEAGYPNGEGMQEIEILFNTHESHRQIGEAIQSMWQEELGVRARLLNLEWKVYLARQQALDYDVARAGWIGDYMDPKTFLKQWVTDNGNNNTGWSNARYDALLAEALHEADPEARYGLLREAEALMLAEHPTMPLYWYTRVYLKDPSLKGWYPKLLDNHPVKYLYFEMEEMAGE